MDLLRYIDDIRVPSDSQGCFNQNSIVELHFFFEWWPLSVTVLYSIACDMAAIAPSKDGRWTLVSEYASRITNLIFSLFVTALYENKAEIARP